MKKPKFLTNWKTTLTGVVTAGAIIFPELVKYTDGDDATTVSWKIVVTAIGVLFGFSLARDGDKSSEGKKV